MAAAKDVEATQKATSGINGHSNGHVSAVVDDAKRNGEATNGKTTTTTTTETQEDKLSAIENKYAANMRNPGSSLKDRTKIPISFMASLASIVGFWVFAGFLTPDGAAMISLQHSYQTALENLQQMLQYTKDLTDSLSLPEYERPPLSEYLVAGAFTFFIAWITYIMFLAPLLFGGFWTGARSHKHVVHRYMGLVYLIQYPLAWIEFARDYDSAKNSFLPHLIALNGITQAWSAFFSFKVLPELNDAGYYSDKSVLSRSFVHENAFFQMMSVFGSVYYIDSCRQALRTTIPGRILEYIYMFWPYILIRPLFPVTRFKDAGSTHKGRSKANQSFYEVGTYMVKIFFLYAKYFLGFYANFLLFLELPTENDFRWLRGCLLLNIGTVSTAVFLHTLRFKKLFPGVLTFSIYLAQIYATVVGIPFAYHVFASHKKLMAVCFVGLLCNMTRSRKMHAAWCFCAMCLLSYPGIEW